MRVLAILLPLLATSEAFFFFSFETETEKPESTTSSSRMATLLSNNPGYLHLKIPYNNVHYSRKPAPEDAHVTYHHHHHHEAVTTEAAPSLSHDHQEAPLQHYFQSRSLQAVVDTAESMLSLYRHFRSDKNIVTPEKTTEYKVTKPVKTSEYVVTKRRKI